MVVSSPPSYKPHSSSPLASPSDFLLSSPSEQASARRRGQYKSRSPLLSSTSRRGRSSGSPNMLVAGGSSSSPMADPPNVIRKRFESRCFERAINSKKAAAASAVKRRRKSLFEPSSDDMDYDCEEEEESVEDVMAGEFFRRCVSNANYNDRYRYKRSYEDEVGSSFDPDMVDIGAMERELRDDAEEDQEPEMTPDELEEAELQAYIADYERQQAAAEFEDIPPEILFQEISDEELYTGSDAAMDMT